MFRRAVDAVPIAVWAWLLAMVPVLVHALQTLPTLAPGSAVPFGVNDSDSWLRLTLVRQWLEGDHWYDHAYRSNGYGGAVSPWTRPLDMVIAAMVKLQPGVPIQLALMRAAWALPILWMGLLVHGLLRCARAITAAGSVQWMVAVMIVMMTATPIMHNYFGIGNADHHAPLTVLYIWVLYVLITFDDMRWRSPVALGLLVAGMVWISPEGLAIVGLAFGWLGGRWLCGRSSCLPLARSVTVSAIATAIALIIERPRAQWFELVHDTLSVIHVIALACTALAIWLVGMLPDRAWPARAGLGMVAILAVAGIIHAIDPRFFGGPLVDADAFIQQVFLPQITEAQSLLQQPWSLSLSSVIQPLVAFLVLCYCARHDDGVIPSRIAALLLLLLAGSCLLYAQQLRWYYYVFPVTALTLGAWFGGWMAPNDSLLSRYWPANRLRWRKLDAVVPRRIARFLAITALPFLILVFQSLPEPTRIDRDACRVEARRVLQYGELTPRDQQSRIVLAPTDLAGALLFYTPHATIAANYHREGAAIGQVWRLFSLNDPQAFMRGLAQHRVGILFICPDPDAGPGAIATRLREGTVELPGWHRVSLTTPNLGIHTPALFIRGTP